jgi:hypothetical protein
VIAITWRGAHIPTRDTLVELRLPAAPVPRNPIVVTTSLVALT